MKLRWIIAGTALTSFIGVGAFALSGLKVNSTGSMPLGVWKSEPFDGIVRRGDVVAICLPATPLMKTYIGPGSCTNGMEPALKVIAAIPGDIVELSANGALVNGVPVEKTAPLVWDTQKRPLEPCPFGRYKMQSDEIFLLSSYSQYSFDSRYFCGVSARNIVARGVPLVVW